jgi:hypothetical protein
MIRINQADNHPPLFFEAGFLLVFFFMWATMILL